MNWFDIADKRLQEILKESDDHENTCMKLYTWLKSYQAPEYFLNSICVYSSVKGFYLGYSSLREKSLQLLVVSRHNTRLYHSGNLWRL